MSPLSVMSASPVHKSAAGAAGSMIAPGRAAFAAEDLAAVAVVVGDIRPRTARRDRRKN